MLISTRTQLQISKLQIQPKEVSGYDLSLVKAVCFNFGLNPIKVTTDVFSGLDLDTSCLQNGKVFFHPPPSR